MEQLMLRLKNTIQEGGVRGRWAGWGVGAALSQTHYPQHDHTDNQYTSLLTHFLKAIVPLYFWTVPPSCYS